MVLTILSMLDVVFNTLCFTKKDLNLLRRLKDKPYLLSRILLKVLPLS